MIRDYPTVWLERCLAMLDRDDTFNDPPPPLDPCHKCGNEAVKRLGLTSYCSTHLAVLYEQFDPSTFASGGVGLPCGEQHPEYGPMVEDLKCCRCGATWAGLAGDPCSWCQREFERRDEYQAELLLTPPEVDPDDATYEARMTAWAARMAVGAKAGTIDKQQAERAWKRAVHKGAA